jgi:hypothetical protein
MKILVSFLALLNLVVFAQDHSAVTLDQGHQTFQPAYAENHLVNFEQRGPASKGIDEAKVMTLYEVEYPTGWEDLLARPLCNYCDHNGDGENAWDYHDHVLSVLPNKEDNKLGEVYWHVLHILPAYTGRAAKDAEIIATYAAQLPVQSGEAARKLLETKLADGTPIATFVDTNYVFTAPLIRW